jgi:hypothetical protein
MTVRYRKRLHLPLVSLGPTLHHQLTESAAQRRRLQGRHPSVRRVGLRSDLWTLVVPRSSVRCGTPFRRGWGAWNALARE